MIFFHKSPGAVPPEPLLCKFADGGQKKRQSQGKYLQNGRTWMRDGETVSLFFSFMHDSSKNSLSLLCNIIWSLFNNTLITLIITPSFVFFPPGRHDSYIWPHHSLTEWVSNISMKKKLLYIQREWDHVVVTNVIVPLSTGSTLLPTALLQTGWLGRPPFPHTCIHLCPPTRY